jgi:hypothetical protein
LNGRQSNRQSAALGRFTSAQRTSHSRGTNAMTAMTLFIVAGVAIVCFQS